jgi:hypothetical protein
VSTENGKGDDDLVIDEQEERDLLSEMGGPQGIADSSLPGLVFIAVYTLGGSDLQMATIAAIGLGALIAVYRLVRGESAKYAAGGFIGVLIAGFIATRTGKAEDFFLPGLLFNAGYALAYFISILVRWPLIGVFVGPLMGEGMTWRKDPDKVKLFSRASWLWVGMFLVRLLVQLPLYLTSSLVALGIAKTVMGLPIFALTLWLTYLMLKREGLDLKRVTGTSGSPKPE